MAAREHDRHAETQSQGDAPQQHEAASVTGAGAAAGAAAGAVAGSVAGPVGTAAGAVGGAVLGGIGGGVAAQGHDGAPQVDQELPDTRGAAEDPLAAGKPKEAGNRPQDFSGGDV